MEYDRNTTIGWSLLTSGVVTLVLWAIPGESVWYGVVLILAGLAVIWTRIR